jgi:HD-GYP domain-containing protein (c-di-GMP phosphodiesterase class II)
MYEEKIVTNLAVGDYVVKIVKQQGNFSLASAGHIKSQRVIAHLQSKGVELVLIDPTKKLSTNNKIPERKLLLKEVKQAKAIFEQSKAIQKRIFADALKGVTLDLKPVIEITNKSVDAIFNNPESLACIVNIREKDEYLLEHSVAVAIYMAIFARYLNIEKSIVEQLSIGAFLHDVGKIMIPDEILNKPGKLTDAEFEIMKTHANHSIEIIKKTPNISALSLEVAALHHEKLNGQGYPNQVKGDDISLYGRMIAICDIFDALTADRVYKEGFSHVKAFAILRELAELNHLDKKLVNQFIKCSGVFPIGSLVELKSKKVAIVEQRNQAEPLKPLVKTFYNAKHQHYIAPKEIDLKKSNDEIVKGVRAKDFNLDMNKIVEMLLMQG